MATLVCPKCSTRYQIDDAKLAKITRLRCQKCRTIFSIKRHAGTQTPPPPAEDEFALAEKMLGALEATEDIETIFKREGQPYDVSGNTPLLLNSSAYVWLVTSGSVDIFTVRVVQGKMVSARTHLLRLQPGSIFFGVDAEQSGTDRVFLAVGAMGSTVRQLDLQRVQDLVRTQEFTAIGLGALIDQWVLMLSEAIQTTLLPQNTLTLPAVHDIQLEEQVTVIPEKGVIWSQHRTGNSTTSGLAPLTLRASEDFFPISKHLWLHTDSPVHLHLAPILESMMHDHFWRALVKFHRFGLECVTLAIKELEAQEQTRLEEKAQEERRIVANAFARLSAVVKTGKKQDVIEATGDPLFAACKLVGDHVGISLTASPRSKKGSIYKDPLQDIARSARIRVRRVILKDDWWKRDNGAFLAYKTEGKRPVALIPNSARSYRLIDPVEGVISNVTSQIADALEGIGYMFYRPFPERSLTWWDLTQFGFYGSGKDLTVIFTVATFGALLGLLPPMLTKKIFNTIIPEANIGQLTQIAIILCSSSIAIALFEITKSIGLLRVEGKLDSSLQAALWDRLLALPVPFFRIYTAGDLANRSLGINAIRQILSGSVVQSLFAGIFSLFYWGLLFYYNWQLALVATALGLTAVCCASLIGYYVVRYQKPIQDLQGKISGLLLQLLAGINKLRITGTEDRALALWTKEFSAQKKVSVKAKTTQNILRTFNTIFPMIASMTIFAWIVYRTKDSMSIGNYLAFNSAYLSFQSALIQMSLSLTAALTAIPIYARLQPILTTPLEIDEAKSSPSQLAGNLEINQVNFRYHPDSPRILHDISLKISAGEFVAFVGSSGSGKSTLMRLLLGFEKPESGSIYYDGQNLDMIDVREVRQQIGVVLQNSRIMQGSILENIIGSSTLTINDAWEAAKMAGCAEDIRAMPMQMHTVLPPGGGTLSGGQRQRILIARAVVKKPRILIFDEATSALDNKTQEIVSKSIEMLNATRIVIAHRLSTIMHADCIYVMEKGQLVQQGTYHELIKKEGLFAELAKRQLA